MDARDRHNGKKDKRMKKRTDGLTDEETRLFVRPSLRWSLTLNRLQSLPAVLVARQTATQNSPFLP